MADCVRCLLLAALACAIQFWLLPRLGDYKPALADALSRATGQQVHIDELGGGWRHGHLRCLCAASASASRTSGATCALLLELAPSLESLRRLEPHFSRIAPSGPVIHIRGDARRHPDQRHRLSRAAATPRCWIGCCAKEVSIDQPPCTR